MYIYTVYVCLVQAALTKYHSVCGLKKHKFVSESSGGWQHPDQDASMIRLLVKVLLVST